MLTNEVNIFTQDDLVIALHKLGHSSIKSRDIATWRNRSLLPEFTVRGRGRGQAAGRQKSGWKTCDEVLSQATCICRLKKIYFTYDEFYLPLFMSGFRVSLDKVWQQLIEPLEEAEEGLFFERDSRKLRERIEGIEDRETGTIEDIIDDLAATQNIILGDLPVPQETIEAFLNLFFNSEYDINDLPFMEGAAKFLDVQNAYNQELIAARGFQDNTTFFDYAPFISKHLSLARLLDALDDCTDNELLVVQHDLKLLRGIGSVFERILLKVLGDELHEKRMLFLSSVFYGFGRLLILGKTQQRDEKSHMNQG